MKNVRKRICTVLSLTLLLYLTWSGLFLPHAHAGTNDPIYGIWFYQPPQDDVHIVYFQHQTGDVTDETFGTQYTDAATAGCMRYVQTLYLVRYRQDPLFGRNVWCYTDPNNYVQISGADFGQATIDAAVARAKQIVYPCQGAKKNLST